MSKPSVASILSMIDADANIESLCAALPFMASSELGNGGFPLQLAPQGAGSLPDQLRVSVGDVIPLLNQVGALLFRGFPDEGDTGFDRFIEALGLQPFTYAESLSNAVRKNRTPRVFTANEAPPDLEIFLHHEMAQTPRFPRYLFFYCERAAETGGATPLCRSDQLLIALKQQMPGFIKQCRELGVRYTHTMPATADSGSGQGRSWQDTLSVTTTEAAETKLDALGYSWTWLTGDDLRVTTPALPAIRQTATGTEVFFNQLVAAFAGWQDHRNAAHSSIHFGDGSSMPASTLETLVALAYQQVYDHSWDSGDILMIDNLRVMHGRRPYSGTRVVLAGLAGALT